MKIFDAIQYQTRRGFDFASDLSPHHTEIIATLDIQMRASYWLDDFVMRSERDPELYMCYVKAQLQRHIWREICGDGHRYPVRAYGVPVRQRKRRADIVGHWEKTGPSKDAFTLCP